MIATKNQVPLHSQFSTELKEEMGNRIAFADISRPTFQGEMLERFEVERIFSQSAPVDAESWLRKVSMWSTSSRDFSRCHFMEIRVTQCSRDIHKRSSLVPNFKIVMLNCVKHAVPSCRCVAETPVKNSLQGLVVNFNMDNITPKNVLCQFLASKHNGEDLFLNLANIISVWVKALNAKLAGCCN